MNPVSAFRDIYEQYVIESSFLWILRSHVVNQPHYTVPDIQELEQRIEAQLDGIMTSIEEGWDACEAALDFEEAGEVFTATVIAFRSREMNNIKKAVDAGFVNDESLKGLISALGWLPDNLAEPWIERFLAGKDMNHKFLGIAACSVRRQDPGDVLTKILQREDCRQHEKLHARSLRLIGELRRQDLMPAINAAVAADSEEVKFWAIWSAIMLGNTSALKLLQPYVFEEGPYHELALQLAFRVLPTDKARSWISKLAKNEALSRSVIKATGILGDPHAVNWLISKMRETEFARLAGESFSMITGVDLEQTQLSIEPPEDQIALPSDDPDDENILMDEDENLPWPDANKIGMLWQQYANNFSVGQRYFLGQPIVTDLLKSRVSTGYQRQRHAAALELALNQPDQALINTRARIAP